ncbi:MAG: hypothetical protein ABW104_20050 [Candidatus Thiodiazotropha sp. 6PLUC2]
MFWLVTNRKCSGLGMTQLLNLATGVKTPGEGGTDESFSDQWQWK